MRFLIPTIPTLISLMLCACGGSNDNTSQTTTPASININLAPSDLLDEPPIHGKLPSDLMPPS